MKTFLIVLLGLNGAYLFSVGVYNAWDFLSGLGLEDVIMRILFFAWLFLLHGVS